ncbi:lipopolysaccharide biosynthesis protein [Sphingomonas sp. SUN019]|uniref:GumC family protein n=1 Tax=Sphingomonas sp. SUN019 TaxID=2937788 RepID=UPI002164CF7A|nr:lipopolysaccharide biosynthesis protein [Sphingomonas sp. SUN019]UVO51471.1 lipopolysaccharide biosynthesis protein [Sphingomonas sp. SUN019]
MNEDDAPTGSFGVLEGVAILYRRRYWLIAPLILGLLGALVAMVVIVPIYRSSATLLITSQQIPTTVVASPLTNYADERIAKIRQRIMSRENLTGLIATHNLYAKERARLPQDEVLGIMRDAIGVDLVGTSANQQHGPAGSTIAFTLSFNYRDARVAQAVTERLTAMFITEDKRLRTEQASGTAAFLGRRAIELRDQLTAIGEKRRAIEARYAGALPEQVAVSAQSGSALRAEVSRIDAETQGLMQQNSLLAARSQEIAATPGAGAEALRRAEERLNLLSTVYSDDFPDVVAARDVVARQRAALRRDATPNAGTGAIYAEVSAGRARIATLAERRAGLVGSISNMDRMASLAPQATYELNNLEREYENVRIQYQGIREKQMEAQVAANLQTEDKGERFSVVDAPSLPLEPTGSGRAKILGMGIAGGLGAGLALLVLWEMIAGAVHGEGGVARIMGAPPLVVVPVLQTGDDAGLLQRLSRLLRLPGHRGAPMWGQT